MHYFRWTGDKIKNLQKKAPGITVLLTEVDASGDVMREVGLDGDGHIVHKCPSTSFRHGIYGLFRLVPFEATEWRDTITEAAFQKYWVEE